MLSQKNKDFILYAIVSLFVFIIAVASWHFIGQFDGKVPEGIQGQVWIFVTIVLGILIQIAREYAARPARKLTQDKLDATHDEVVGIRHDIHDGVQQAIAQQAADVIIPAVAEIVKKEGNGTT